LHVRPAVRTQLILPGGDAGDKIVRSLDSFGVAS